MPRRKRRIATIDAETDPFKYGREPKPFCWGFFDGETYVDFWGRGLTREQQAEDCTRQLIEYLEDEDDLIIYAHNGGKFDFFFLLPFLDPDLFLINGRIAKATLFDGRIELRDSWLIIPLPLSAFQKDEISYSLFEVETRQLHKGNILRYLASDCRYLYNWVSDFIDQFGMGLTLAGTAFKELRKTGYEISNTFDSFDTQYRNFYYGGRVQCFQTGAFYGQHDYVDINSAYSDATMQPHWYGSQDIESSVLPEKENGSWFANIKARSWGALPWRDENNNGKLYFPDDGKSRTYLASGWEIIKGLETGTLIVDKVISVYEPLFTESFESYINKFFAMKREADEALRKNPNDTYAAAKRQFAKLFLNACYGKFGQDGRQFEKYSLQEFGDWPLDKDGNPDLRFNPDDTFIEGYQMFCRPDPVDRFYNVATAASITGYVRANLWGAIQQSDTPLYCDTDSIICKKFNGKMGKELGEWDLEASPIEVHIAQRKMYGMRMSPYGEFGPVNETKVASKGVRLKFDDIKDGIADGSTIHFEKDAPAFSLKYGARFLPKDINFSDIEKNALTFPVEAA